MRLDGSLPAVSREPGPHVRRPCDTISGDTSPIRLRRFVIRNLLDFDQIVLRECADKAIDTEFILSPPNYEPHLFRDRRETHPEAPGQRECESSLWHKQ
jgi:hypothetical protein